DVKLSASSGTTPPTVSLVSPANASTSASVTTYISGTFSENLDATTVTSSTFTVKDASNNAIAGTVSYSSSTQTATFIPTGALLYSTVYTATLKGGSSGIKDTYGNALASDYTWSFTTTAAPATPPDEGGGGPILVISSSTNPFSRYPVEILRAEGYNGFEAMDITEVEANTSLLNNYDVIVLGQFSLSGTDVTTLTNWVNAGGTLIALRPDAGLASLLGITSTGNTLSDAYLLASTGSGPGKGIVNQTIQFHGTADLYTLQGGTTSIATLYSDAATATAFPAITTRSVGSNGGSAVAFTYDLAKSIVYTRQGNPAWVGTNRDGQTGPIRSDDLFYPNYVDFNKIQIPQADEQQHLLSNIILSNNLHRKPMPHLWFLPSGLKAAVVMTGDDHATGNTVGRFNEYLTLGPNTAQDVADWKAVRGTSYIYTATPISDDDVNSFQSQGFEIGLHPYNGCTDYTPASLDNVFSTQLSIFQSNWPSATAPVTNRTHCMPWTDWSSHPSIEFNHGIRFDVNYYYWPGAWIQNRPGLFTGSGMPMRFAAIDGTLIDCYQAPTQIPDESQLDIPNAINTLLSNATGSPGYYGIFTMNMHTDTAIHVGSDEIIASAQSYGIPVVSAKQMLTWIDNRNNTVFGPMTWSNNHLDFTITTTAHNLQAMVPVKSASGSLTQVNQNGSSISYTVQTIKGLDYAFFPASTNSYTAIYSSALPVTLVNLKATVEGGDNVQLTWQTEMEQNNKGFEIQRSTDGFNWSPVGFVNGAGQSNTTLNYKYDDNNLDPALYYYRLKQVDYDSNFVYSNVVTARITSDGQLVLYQNYPNPYVQNTTIKFDLPRAQNVRLTLFDANGRQIKVLVDGYTEQGSHIINFQQQSLSSGLYYYKLDAEDGSAVRKMVIK
ncbi:MAG: Ig-like domain-containing protein, partial [Bacteroidetes bacterium]|nr:Ig-like domain-containing protein [Bacteroidota bacterium]